MAHISFLSNFFGLLPQDYSRRNCLYFTRRPFCLVGTSCMVMYDCFLFITADRALVVSRLHHYPCSMSLLLSTWSTINPSSKSNQSCRQYPSVFQAVSGRREDSRDEQEKQRGGWSIRTNSPKSYPVKFRTERTKIIPCPVAHLRGGSIPWGVVAADISFAIICGAHRNALTH